MNTVQNILDNEYVAFGIAFLVAIYGAGLTRMELPGYLRNLFTNNIFRVIFLSLLMIHNFDRTPHIAVAIALIFVLTLNQLSNQEAKENFVHLEAFRSSIRNKQ
jgi:hypothetical protein